MPTTLVLHAPPAAGFDQPFELLAACHGRVERTLTLLEQLAEHLTRRGADDQARQAALDVMRYFDVAAPEHHEDEERHVFPLLFERGDDAMRDLVRRLRADHLRMTQLWSELRASLLAVSRGRWDLDQAEAVFTGWRDYSALYQRHADAEERIAFPAARAWLVPEAQLQMGREMAGRRGVAA